MRARRRRSRHPSLVRVYSPRGLPLPSPRSFLFLSRARASALLLRLYVYTYIYDTRIPSHRNVSIPRISSSPPARTPLLPLSLYLSYIYCSYIYALIIVARSLENPSLSLLFLPERTRDFSPPSITLALTHTHTSDPLRALICICTRARLRSLFSLPLSRVSLFAPLSTQRRLCRFAGLSRVGRIKRKKKRREKKWFVVVDVLRERERERERESSASTRSNFLVALLFAKACRRRRLGGATMCFTVIPSRPFG